MPGHSTIRENICDSLGCCDQSYQSHWQLPNAYKTDSDLKQDVAEVTNSGVEGFSTEIADAISDISGFEKDIDETNAPVTLREPMNPTILFTNAEETDEEDPDHVPKME